MTTEITYRGILHPAYEVSNLLKMAAGFQPLPGAERREMSRIKAMIDWDGGVYGEPIYVRFPASLLTQFEQTEMFAEIVSL